MAVGYKARKRLALFILVIGLPAYIVLAVTMMGIAPGFSKPIELLIYVLLGVAWIFPIKWVFKGIGQPDPDA
ncbi:DUF2842 domain-containing protein [Loktanella sp. D2R18]|uniref:DUF2842 domain-containing protein n=1 Tax=Rhodobacterales TaxID=204455 RepID=UPI000DEB1E09|nr:MULTISPECIES: DUF2842 domain-containing protein [Rhodobacterales]MDO6591699.1 DUF2842 domain-containing protein [Yoonia sp. 1_MG-2023]RBW42524.1 DUF2842 domain-containing protein [Loktanella sp. D2R18]